ncbi:MAG: Mrp/NBP35 family ATP-binding protein [Bacteroidota bacterium]
MSITNQDVLKALSHVDDPDLKKDLVTLNMVRDIAIAGNTISFSVYLTTPACPLKDMIENACRNAISHFIGDNYTVNIKMTAEVTADKKTNASLPNVKNIIAVASGKGGVGKSTVAAGIATCLSRLGASVGILDADIYGPSIPIIFGVQNQPVDMVVVDSKELMNPIMAENIKLFSIGFLSKPDEAIVWRGPMVSQALRQFISGVHWGNLDYLIIDLPPGTGDVQLTLAQTLPISGAVIVTTPQNLSIADAGRACSMFTMPSINVPILGIVENMSYFTPDDQPDKKYHIFGKGGAEKLAQTFNSRVLGTLPISSGLMEDSDNGKILHTENLENFTEIAQQLARQLAINNAN